MARSHDSRLSLDAHSISSARKELEAGGQLLFQDGVAPHDISIADLIAPLPTLRSLIGPDAAEFASRKTGPAQFQAAIQIGEALEAATVGLPDDLRTLRKRPASVQALQVSANALLSGLLGIVRRQARGKTMRALAQRFSPRTGSSVPELISDLNAFLAVATEPEIAAAFEFLPADLQAARDAVASLSAVAGEMTARGALTDKQLQAIDLDQLSLEAFYAKLAGNIGLVLRGAPMRRNELLTLIPRSAAGRNKVSGEPTGTTTQAPAPRDGGGTIEANTKK